MPREILAIQNSFRVPKLGGVSHVIGCRAHLLTFGGARISKIEFTTGVAEEDVVAIMEIGKDVAAQYVEGWDWMAPIRDRNTGIWDEVSLAVTGPVKIVDPHLVSSFFDNYKRAYLHTTMELVNKSNLVAECTLNIQVGTELEGNVFLVEHLQTQHLSIPAGSHVQHTLPEIMDGVKVFTLKETMCILQMIENIIEKIMYYGLREELG
ncbi:mannosylglycoprotein endo-beta-mannosidase [Phtheirospermum japonicum]|uniref:Mannosylglycoprotein endo-beta-mannosidase n=1 Tax=Phtheirospermum japonicum TaxID=374723 RepID=A0A830BTG2_9LAMI|nr:mannosylglycoprotein endo-beta-mannosidase [Phtheirospermum japonicum]